MEVDAFLRDHGRPALEAWLTEPGTQVFELPPYWAESGWTAAPFDTDPDGLRPCRLERHGPDGVVAVQTHVLTNGWGIGSTPWTDTLALAPALPVQESDGRGGVRELPATIELVDAYQEAARRFDEQTPAELQALVTREVERVAEWLGWEPPEPVRVEGLTPDELRPLFVAFHTERNARKPDWGRAELDRLTERNRARGDEAPESLRLVGYDPEERADGMLAELDGFSPAGPTLYLQLKGEVAGLVAEHIIVHELVHEYQEHLVDHGGLFPAPAPYGTLLEPHAEWHAARILRARYSGLERHVGIAYFVPLMLFTRLLDELDVGPDEALRRFYDGRWDAYVFDDVLAGALSLHEYLFHEHGRSHFDVLDFRLAEAWAEEATVIVTNRTAELVRAQLAGIWLFDVSEGRGEFATVRTAPANVVLPARGELRLRLSAEPILTESRVFNMTGLFAPTPSAIER